MIVDCPHKTAPRTDDEPYAYAVGTRAITGEGRINLDSARPVEEDIYRAWVARAVPQPGDLILCREAPVGPVARIPDGLRVCLGQRTVLLRPNPRVVDGRFLRALLRGPEAQRAMHEVAEGSTVPHLNVADVRRLRIRFPELGEQAAVASVLGALDDKIESNRRLDGAGGDLLEAWFRALVGSASDREPVSSLAIEIRTRVNPRDRQSSIFEQFSIPAFDAGRGPEVCSGGEMASAKTLLSGDPVVLISKLNPTTQRVWWPERLNVGIPVCSPEFVALSPRNSGDAAWLYGCIAFDQRFYDQVLAAVTGTTGSRQRVKPADVTSADVPIVDPERRGRWESFARPILARRVALLRESRTLTTIRDALLPKLVSGQIRVPLSNDPEEWLGTAIEALA